MKGDDHMTRLMPASMPMTTAKITERLVPISDFSKGKAAKIFTDVANNDNEYIVLRNNKPTAIVISVKTYESTLDKLNKFEQIFEELENLKLLRMAQSRKGDNYTTFESLIEKEGFTLDEIKKLSESVEFE